MFEIVRGTAATGRTSMLVDHDREIRVIPIGGSAREQVNSLVLFASEWTVPFETEWRTQHDGRGVVRRLINFGASLDAKKSGFTANMPTDERDLALLRRFVLEACLALGVSFGENGIEHPDGWSLLIDGEVRYTLSDFGPYPFGTGTDHE